MGGVAKYFQNLAPRVGLLAAARLMRTIDYRLGARSSSRQLPHPCVCLDVRSDALHRPPRSTRV